MDHLESITTITKISGYLFIGNNKIPQELNLKNQIHFFNNASKREGIIAMRAIKILITRIAAVKHKNRDNLLGIYSKPLQ